jgi:hypothetical protein
MRGESFGYRCAITAAVCCVSLLLLACPVGQLRVLIPDYVTSEVKGVQIFRVDDVTAELVPAGHVQFQGIENGKNGELMQYEQFDAAGVRRLGRVYAQVIRDPSRPSAIELTLSFWNWLPPGWFKVASYNAHGSSPVSTGRAFVMQSERG